MFQSQNYRSELIPRDCLTLARFACSWGCLEAQCKEIIPTSLISCFTWGAAWPSAGLFIEERTQHLLFCLQIHFSEH